MSAGRGSSLSAEVEYPVSLGGDWLFLFHTVPLSIHHDVHHDASAIMIDHQRQNDRKIIELMNKVNLNTCHTMKLYDRNCLAVDLGTFSGDIMQY